MSIGLGKCSKIRHIVRLRQMLKHWRCKAAQSCRRIPPDIPAGHIAVSVGANHTRFVIRATHLNHPAFQKLLSQAEEVFGFSNHGPLAIPCDEFVFQEILRSISRSGPRVSSARYDDALRFCHVDALSGVDYGTDSKPLLQHTLAWKTTW
uniref:Small auxin up regulated protein n=1 Tax=Kalanchoe fedtschenkoi TaxID=63787 RepID=A0A7N0U2W3_KALFE